MNTTKPRLLLVTHVNPFPGIAGQQQRVRYTLQAINEVFRVTVVTVAPPSHISDIERKWLPFAEDVVVLPSISQRHLLTRIYHKIRARLYQATTQLKESNYILGTIEYDVKRILSVVKPTEYNIVLFEYWHSHHCAAAIRAMGIPTVLDMHDILWQSLKRQLSHIKSHVRERRVASYRLREEAAWEDYNALIAINEREAEYVRKRHPNIPVLLAQMGTDLTQWPYLYEQGASQRVGFWGSLSSQVNLSSAMRAATEVMPIIWREMPNVEFWIIGANPPTALIELQSDNRIRVTGFVETAGPLLGSMTAVLCPWEGTYGFRSRIVEVMACGVPVVASPDAVYGMGMQVGMGLLLGDSNQELAQHVIRLLSDKKYSLEQSHAARLQIENKYSFEATYGRLKYDLLSLAGYCR